MITKVTKVYLRHYTDSDQKSVYVEWIDEKGEVGRTESYLYKSSGKPGLHMIALLNHAKRDGITMEYQTW